MATAPRRLWLATEPIIMSTSLATHCAILRALGGRCLEYRRRSFLSILEVPILLVLPIIFGTSRSVTAGKRIVIGSFVGIALFFADQLAVHLGLLLSLHPVITAMAPVVFISAIAGWQLRRMIMASG